MKQKYILVIGILIITAQHHPLMPQKGARMKITSQQFQDGGTMPSEATCDGQDISPALAWSEIPTNAKSLVLICDDPDAPSGTWTHWVVFNIPATIPGLKEGQDCQSIGAHIGANSWSKPAYGGPCPLSGTHRYYFRLYALDTTLNLKRAF